MHVALEYKTLNGLRLCVHRYADEEAAPSGVTALLLHGYMDAARTWDHVAAGLARAGHAVVVPDLRGFGASERVGAGGYYHFPDYVADVSALVDDLAPERLAVVGHSMGGTIAALYAGTFPDRVWRLALLEGLGPLSLEPARAVDRMRAWLRDLKRLERASRPIASIEEAASRLATNHPRLALELLEDVAAKLTTLDDEGHLVWAFDPLHRSTSPSLFQASIFEAFLAEIACPTLCVSGGPLGFHAPDEVERAARLRSARHVEIADAGHMMHWTEPEALVGHLARFLSPTGE